MFCLNWKDNDLVTCLNLLSVIIIEVSSTQFHIVMFGWRYAFTFPWKLSSLFVVWFPMCGEELPQKCAHMDLDVCQNILLCVRHILSYSVKQIPLRLSIHARCPQRDGDSNWQIASLSGHHSQFCFRWIQRFSGKHLPMMAWVKPEMLVAVDGRKWLLLFQPARQNWSVHSHSPQTEILPAMEHKYRLLQLHLRCI